MLVLGVPPKLMADITDSLANHRQHDATARPQYAPRLDERSPAFRNVVDARDKGDGVEARVGERKFVTGLDEDAVRTPVDHVDAHTRLRVFGLLTKSVGMLQVELDKH